MSGRPFEWHVPIQIAAVPEVLFLDTPECVAAAEFFTQRSKHTLTKTYPRRGLKIHVVPGESKKGEMDARCGDRPYIVLAEYLTFLKTIEPEGA